MSAIRLRTTIAACTAASVIVLDQVIKYFVKTNMWVGQRIDITPWFKIFFTENKGMAFGMDFIGTFFLALVRVAAVILFSYVLVNIVRKRAPIGLILCWACVVAGAAGNIIDNCFYGLIYSESAYPYPSIAELVPWGEGYGSFLSGRVVDMFYFPLFTWPQWMPLIGGDVFFGAVFNFADAAISCGAVALLIFYRDWLTGNYLFKRSELSPSTSSSKDPKTVKRNEPSES